jgi:AAA-like domain
MAQQSKRRRGVILTNQGLEKFQGAISDAECCEKNHKRYTLQFLSDRTSLDPDTLRKALARETAVDKRTLSYCFRAFNLSLEPDDYVYMVSESRILAPQDSSLLKLCEHLPQLADLEVPDGPVELESKLYVERFPVEAISYQTVVKPGFLIRIKAPQQMGKTSLMTRILHKSQCLGYYTIALNLQLADDQILQDLDRFLRWLCMNVSRGLQLPNRLADYWDEILGSKMSCKDYFENYLLAQLDRPLVLALDNVDSLFQYPEIASNVFALLRVCYEEAKNSEIWKKFRLVLIHSTEVDIPLKIYQSLFNVGLSIELPEFLSEHVCKLVYYHGLLWDTEQIEKLMAMIGGHPYLVRVALYHLARQDMTLEQLVRLAPTEAGPYKAHLYTHLYHLKQQPALAANLKAIVDATSPLQIEPLIVFKLDSMGLIHLKENGVVPRCEMYRQYFRDRLF